MPVTLASESAFVAQLALLVPDMKGGYTEANFVQEAVDALSEDVPGWEAVDVGDGSTRAWQLGASPFGGFLIGFSDVWPIEYEALDSSGSPFADPADFTPAPRLDQRYSSAPQLWLVFPVAPGSSSKCRVKFRKPWTISGSTITVPARWHLAVVKKAAAKKCAALATFYKNSIDPSGGSDIFDARQYAQSYADDAERWDAEYAKLVGLGSAESGFEAGQVKRGAPSAFSPWDR